MLARARHGLGRLTLNRPQAINALDIEMICLVSAALDEWEHHPDVQRVLLDGAGDRGLCAGGDLRALAATISGGNLDDTAEFFRREFALNARIAEYPKPVIALADGVTMGGGIGLAGHAPIRVVTERSRLAMPETRIGFTPDVGGSWLLGRAPGRLGEYLGLTGASMNAADAIYAGFADHFVPSDRLESLRDAFEMRADPASAVELVLLFDETPDAAPLSTARAWIDDAFAADTVAEIIARLRDRPEPDAQAAARTLDELSPTSLAVTLGSVRAARELPNLRAALEQEYGLVMWLISTQPDLLEGIRAQVIDKDRMPAWQPSSIAGVSPSLVHEALSFRPCIPLWD